MSEDNHYGAHPVATVPSHYSIQGPQHSGIQAGPPPQIPTNQSYGYREEASQYHYNMNGVAGGSQQNHAPQIYPYQMASAPRAPPPPSSQWPSYNSNNYHAPDERRGPPIDHIQSNTASYSPAEPTWNKIRPQHSASDQNYSHPHNMGGHSSANYGYSRPSHLPLEPIAAPSPPRTYPNSPRTPLPPHPSSNQNGIPAQSFRSHTVSRGPLVVSIASPMENAAIHRPEPSSSHGSTYGESSRSSPATQSLLSRQQGRHNMVSPLGPPPSALGNFEGGPHRPYAQNRGSESYSRGPVENSVKLERRGSSPKPARNSYAPQPDYDSMDDSRRIKQERSSREPSPDVSPGASRADRPDDRSPSYTGSVNRDSKGNILEALPKKRGAPVFTDGNGQEYYENEVVPPGVALPHGWQLGVGKLTKGLLLPCHKDGIQVNPEWGFTAGGKARQRLPQACKNCRAKKIRCV